MAGSLIHKFTNVFHQKPFRALKKGHDIIKGNKILIRVAEKNPKFTAKDLQDDPMKGVKTYLEYKNIRKAWPWVSGHLNECHS